MDRPRSIITNRLFHHEEGRNRTAAQRKTKIDRFTRANITKKGVGCRRHPFILRLYKKEEGRKIKRVEHNNKNIPAEVEINKKKTVLLFIKKKKDEERKKKKGQSFKEVVAQLFPATRIFYLYNFFFDDDFCIWLEWEFGGFSSRCKRHVVSRQRANADVTVRRTEKKCYFRFPIESFAKVVTLRVYETAHRPTSTSMQMRWAGKVNRTAISTKSLKDVFRRPIF